MSIQNSRIIKKKTIRNAKIPCPERRQIRTSVHRNAPTIRRSNPAAAFLRKFVPEGIPWAHLDIAGTAWVEKASDWAAEGATLAAARLLYEWVGDSAL